MLRPTTENGAGMPDNHDMLSQRIELLQKSVDNHQAETNKSLNKMADSVTNLATLMTEKAANDKHVEAKLVDVRDEQKLLAERVRVVEDYITTRSATQKYTDWFWRAIIMGVAGWTLVKTGIGA